MFGGLDMEEGLASGAGGEGVVALSAARHVGTVRLGQAVDRSMNLLEMDHNTVESTDSMLHTVNSIGHTGFASTENNLWRMGQ